MSYDLHKELSDKFGGADKWGYRTVHTLVRAPVRSEYGYNVLIPTVDRL